MDTFVLVLWLTLDGPEVTLDVNDCSYATMRVWAHEAHDWALRSGLDPRDVGYLCWSPAEWGGGFVKVRAHR